jgi:predicted PurR-regulated permease PerM
LLRWLNVNNIDWRDPLRDSVRVMGGFIARALNTTSRVTISFILHLLALFFILFYFFRDGDKLVEYLKSLLPLEDRDKNEIFSQFHSIARATIQVTLLMGLMQGTFGAATLWIFGISTWLLWGVIMVFLAVLPAVGAWVVLIPAGIIKIAGGEVWQGITIMIITVAFISVIDDVIRPHFVGKRARVHDLLIFLTMLGGIAFFGILGFIIGPVFAALLIALLDIYRREFRPTQHPGQAGAR